jgi:hypothetical protein
MKAANKAEYFIGIDEPLQLRKNLLETAKLSVYCLRGQHRLRALGKQKVAVLEQLNANIDAIEKLMEQVRDAMPEHSQETVPESAKRFFEKEKAEKAKKAAAKKVEKSPELPVESEKNEIELLERKLALIEKKLNKL